MPFLKNFNVEVSSNNKYDVATMMDVVPKVSDVITYYASHHLCANVKFSAIEKITQSTKTHPSIIFMVPDHKQNVLRTRYWEIQVDDYGIKGMSLLGIMEKMWKVDGEVSGFEHSFVDYVIKRYSGQYHMQVTSVIYLSVDVVQDRHLSAKRSSFSQIMQVIIFDNN